LRWNRRHQLVDAATILKDPAALSPAAGPGVDNFPEETCAGDLLFYNNACTTGVEPRSDLKRPR